MPLNLPADLEPFVDDYDDLHDPGVYALILQRPADPAAAWDRAFDARPPWWDRFVAAETVAYVGASGDVLSRLEEHRDGAVRQATLLQVCAIDRLHTVWRCDSQQEAFDREYTVASTLDRERPGWYVHSR